MLEVKTEAVMQDFYINIKYQDVYIGGELICRLPSRMLRQDQYFPKEEWSSLRKLGQQQFKKDLNILLSKSLKKQLMQDESLERFLSEVKDN